MTSMVLHLAITILFASLAIKSGPRPNAVLVFDLSATMADQIDENLSTVEIMPIESSPLAGLQEDSNTTLVRLEDPVTIPIKPPTDQADTTESQATESEDPDSPGNGPAGEAAEMVAVSEESPFDTPDFVRKATAAVALHDELPYVPKTLTYDNIVERFIEYDIGNLRGEAGNRAQREFNRLGPDAIPALVRGLNQSAQIRASCPVVVISSKLEQTLQQTNDQATIDYVLQNLGRDVPHNAPHAKRIESFRANLAKMFVDRKFKQDFAGVRPIREEPRLRWVARVKRLYHANADELATALQDERPEEQTAAWAAISMRERFDLTPSDRLRLAELLLNQWPRYTDAYRKRIHDALTTLAAGSGVARGIPAFGRNDTLRRWHYWWSEHGRTEPEVASSELVRLAKFSSNRANTQRLLARAVEKFPGTRNAELARHMLAPDAKLTLAQSLERQSRWAEAILLYEEIAADFPDSQHAPMAQRRLDVLGGFREPQRASE